MIVKYMIYYENLLIFTGDEDYCGFDTIQLIIPQGEKTVNFNVTIKDDDLIELNETFSVHISNISGNSRVLIDNSTDTATVTIIDTDSMFNYIKYA